jgi:hypothetical protein
VARGQGRCPSRHGGTSAGMKPASRKSRERKAIENFSPFRLTPWGFRFFPPSCLIPPGRDALRFLLALSLSLAHPQFLKRGPFDPKSSVRGRGLSWGSGWRNWDHHPEAVVLPMDRACPGEICRERGLGSVFCLGGFPLRPLPAEHRGEVTWNDQRPPSLMIQIPPP